MGIKYMFEESVSNNKVIDLIVNARYRLLRHSVFCLGLLVIIFFSNWLNDFTGIYKYYRLLSVYAVLLAMFYINIYVLIPVFFFRNKYVIYLALLIVLVLLGLTLLSTLMNVYFTPMNMPGPARKGLYEGAVIMIPLISSTTTIKLFQRWAKANERIAELKNVTLTMELNGLKNQINPHFLFNMLNGIKALIRRDPEKATIVIMKLSEFLRYQLYENDAAKTMLKTEINFLSNFLDLEKLRRDNFSVEVNCKIDPRALKGIFLPPNLFTTFVENAIKHSITVSDPSYIKIDIDTHEHKLFFTCINSKAVEYCPSGKNSGLGLANIKRRLDLLFEGNYSLEIESNERQYTVNLIIPV